jgi:hypothetical protein
MVYITDQNEQLTILPMVSNEPNDRTVVGIDLAGSPKRNTGICTLKKDNITLCSIVHADQEIFNYIEKASPTDEGRGKKQDSAQQPCWNADTADLGSHSRSLHRKDHTLIMVEGEEDLLTLVTVIEAPENALVLCVDEKPHIQALERAQGWLRLPDGKAVTPRRMARIRHAPFH